MSRLARRPRWAVCFGAVLLALTVAPVHAQSISDPLVLAFYYPWYDETTWTYDQLSDLPAEPYVSRDRGVMGRQIDQAKAAGIDALLVAWYGPGGGNQTESNLAAMLDEANARGFKIGVLFETTSPFFSGTGDVTAALQHLLTTHANHPAFLRADGRPVIFFWRPTLYGVDTWREHPQPGRSQLCQPVDFRRRGHELSVGLRRPPSLFQHLEPARRPDRDQRQSSPRRWSRRANPPGAYKLWVATVMPGYNDVRIRSNGFAHDRAGGTYFAQSWQAAIASQPNWIVINSFNEWPEGTYIEPSAAFGDQFLGIAATYSAQFKAGRCGRRRRVGRAATDPARPLPPPTDRPPPLWTPRWSICAPVPALDYAIIGQVAAGTALPIRGQHPAYPDWWQVDAGDGPAGSMRRW